MNIDSLDSPGSKNPFRFQHDDVIHEPRSPVDMAWRTVLESLCNEFAFLANAVGTDLRGLPMWKVGAIRDAWVAHYDLLGPQPARRLCHLVDRYCGPIEASLARYYPGVDLATEWRSRRWRKLLNLIDHLPRNSAYVEAMADDDELAERMVGEDREPSGPRLSDWSPEREGLADVVDMLGSVIQAVIAAQGVKPPTVSRSQRPQTAFDRARKRRRMQRHLDLVGMLLPPS